MKKRCGGKRGENMKGQLSILNFIKSALWKYDTELGIAYFCPDCKKFICISGKCDCGTEIDLDLPKKEYKGKVKW